jgi:methyltransferase (TIGR00027 family)
VSRLNLEHQRKRARALLKGVRRRDSEALLRVMQAGARSADTLALHDAQLVIARENGFTSWSRLKAHVGSEHLEHRLLLSARVMAANRAAETARRDALYRDPLASDLAGEDGWAAFHAVQRASWPGYASGPDAFLTILTRFFDDALVDAVRRAGMTQVVIAPAGMDTRAFRLEWPSGVQLFEVDTDDIFAHKDQVLHQRGALPRCQRHAIVTRSHASLKRALRRTAFDATRPTAFLLERLQYLRPEGVERLLRELTALASDGSWIGFAHVTRETLRADFMQPYLRKLEAAGLAPWRFGIDEPEAWLATYGWNARSVVAGAPEASYGRWPYGYIPRGTPAVPRGFFTVGWKTRQEDPWPSSR